MHQNYYFLKKLAPRLHQHLAGYYFIEAFSQEKNELLIVFDSLPPGESLSAPFFIKLTLRPDFSCLSFPEKFDRARRNSVNLFTEFEGQKLQKARVCLNERAIRLDFESGVVLVLKMFGNRSNLIGFDESENVTSLFNNKLIADQEVALSNLDRPLDQSFEAYLEADMDHKVLFPTFGKLINSVLTLRLQGLTSPEQKWAQIQSLLEDLDRDQYYLSTLDLNPTLSLLPLGEQPQIIADPVEALNQFYLRQVRLNGIEKEKGEIIRILRKRITQTENYLENTFNKLVKLESAVKNEEIGHIIMANLHAIPARAESVELYDFYRDKNIIVKLKKDYSPQKNAEGYYRKAKNEKIELEKLNDSITVRQAALEELKMHLSVIEGIEQLRELRAYIKNQQLTGSKANMTEEVALFKKLDFMGFTILVGRNAKNNDLLTKQYAFKEDMWLHARDVSGSHVVIKYQPGKNFPDLVIERAAEIAAFYSKRKNESLCPVIVTPKKFVRKPKGLPDGAVVVDKERVVMVVPRSEKA
ncbi:NFACT RNA binding domain-containing protein [Dyadobacter tibetensis]|uniref:NFACT RNA binding domain-containing protein n=1 Tax=Dyadobacter tibetensis TaxID=1211851 RepID=UPI00046E87F4|nr:NFACT RNA binding domain-containing protein [Dyadobacter tibetensis]